MYKAEEMNVALNNCKTAASELRVVLNTENVAKADIDKAENKLKEALAAYNTKVRENAYETICNNEDPVKAAALAYSFSGLARKKVEKEQGTDRIKCITILTDDTEPYKLKKLESTYADLFKKELMVGQKWSACVGATRLFAAATECKLMKCDMQKFREAFGMTGDMLVYNDEGVMIDVCDMSEAEKEAWTDDLTITQTMNRLQLCIDNILFDGTKRDDGQNGYRVRREDARFFAKFMFWLDDKTGKPHIRTFDKSLALMFVVLSHVVSGVAYDMIWKEENKSAK